MPSSSSARALIATKDMPHAPAGFEWCLLKSEDAALIASYYRLPDPVQSRLRDLVRLYRWLFQRSSRTSPKLKSPKTRLRHRSSAA